MTPGCLPPLTHRSALHSVLSAASPRSPFYPLVLRARVHITPGRVFRYHSRVCVRKLRTAVSAFIS
eukprot:3583400-Pleurochrysis_carterae.AAC.1